MEELLKFVGALPLPAAISFGSVLAIIVWVARLGILEGRKVSPGNDQPVAQVAAVIVDPTALNNATAALNRHTNTMEKLIEIGEGMARTMDHMAIEMDRIREELRIHREISRRN
jgi:hypothetical protein